MFKVFTNEELITLMRMGDLARQTLTQRNEKFPNAKDRMHRTGMTSGRVTSKNTKKRKPRKTRFGKLENRAASIDFFLKKEKGSDYNYTLQNTKVGAQYKRFCHWNLDDVEETINHIMLKGEKK